MRKRIVTRPRVQLLLLILSIFIFSTIPNKATAQKTAEYDTHPWDSMVILILYTVFGTGIFILYSLTQKNKRAASKKIEQLNLVIQLQIAELEERSRMIKMDEQKKLGMGLHDNILGTIVAVKNKLELEIIESEDIYQKDRLLTIKDHIHSIYESIRIKSHELYHGRGNDYEISFSKRIQLVIDTVFSANKFKTEITVDDETLLIAPIEIKIELLYIIQEAITNIIKHSQANKVLIFIYEDNSGLVLYVSDNGKGFNITQQKKGIGLKSIKDRATLIDGTVDIVSSNNGTELTVTIPIPDSTFFL